MSTSYPPHTVTDLLNAYEAEYLPTKAATTHYQQSKLFIWLRKELGYMLLTDLTPAFLRQWRDILSKRYAPGTVRRYLDSLSAPLTVAVRDYEWLPSNPLRKVRKPPETPGRVRFLSDEERARLFAACQVSRNPHLACFVLLVLSTGARKEQVRQLRWRDVDLAPGLARGSVRLGASKSTRARRVPLLGPVLALLRTRGTGQPLDAWVFARHDGLKPILVDMAFGNACRRAGVRDFRIHDLRHSAASYLAMSGATPRDVQEVLGHRNINQTARYTHLTMDHTAGVLEKMIDTFLASLLGAATLTTLVSAVLAAG